MNGMDEDHDAWADAGPADEWAASGEGSDPGVFLGPDHDDDRLRLSDVGKLARSARRRRIVRRCACRRPADLPGPAGGAPGHTSARARGRRGVMAGLRPRQRAGRPRRLARCAWTRHRLVGLSALPAHRVRPRRPAAAETLTSTDRRRERLLVAPGQRAGWAAAAAVRAGLYLAQTPTPGWRSWCGPRPGERFTGSAQVHLVADRPGAAAETSRRRSASSRWSTTCSGDRWSPSAGTCSASVGGLQFHDAARVVAADDVIMPPETMAMIKRQVVGVAEHRAQLMAARQHLKRGLLLYGPPGVGKTHSVRYLISQLVGSPWSSSPATRWR